MNIYYKFLLILLIQILFMKLYSNYKIIFLCFKFYWKNCFENNKQHDEENLIAFTNNNILITIEDLFEDENFFNHI